MFADPAQRRPGREPRRHSSESRQSCMFADPAQRRPGREPRRHRRRTRCRPAPRPSAQRRPGREPRRHDRLPRKRLRVAPRSTKAGARTPATPRPAGRGRRGCSALNEGRGANPGDTVLPAFTSATMYVAQRRPGREPRRHVGPSAAARSSTSRSTKAGARTPATLVPPVGRERRLRRSTKAGARTPATPSASRSARSTGCAQRRPGREPRRHPGRL